MALSGPDGILISCLFFSMLSCLSLPMSILFHVALSLPFRDASHRDLGPYFAIQLSSEGSFFHCMSFSKDSFSM